MRKDRNLLKNIRIVTHYVATFQHPGKLEKVQHPIECTSAQTNAFFKNCMEHQWHCEPTSNQKYVELCTSIVLDVAHHSTLFLGMFITAQDTAVFHE